MRQSITLFGLKKVLEGMTIGELPTILSEHNQRSFARSVPIWLLMNLKKRIKLVKHLHLQRYNDESHINHSCQHRKTK